MSETKFCKTCKKNLESKEFTFENKNYATCNICRNNINIKRRKHICEICGITALFNFKGKENGIRCKSHIIKYMINVRDKKCIMCNEKIPLFNYENQTKATHCKNCAKDGMIDIIHTKCIVCNKKTPNFNYENENKATHCKSCAKLGMIDIKNKKCIVCNKKTPNFNYEGETKATHCKNCSTKGMIDIIRRKCIVCNEKTPIFNFEGEVKATHCKNCSTKGMIDIIHKKCIVCKKKIPNFNFEGETKPTHCKDCSTEDMIDIKNRRCVECKKKRPSFNFEGEVKATHCKDCSTEGMIDIKNKKCIVCKRKIPIFNFEGEVKATHCKDCSVEGMIDIKNKKCIVCKRKIPIFNFEGEIRGTHCRDCSIEGMIDIKNKKCVECKTFASFGFINQLKTHCTRHKLPLMFKKKYYCQECDEIAEYGMEEPSHCFIHQKPEELCLLGQKCKKCYRENELCNKDQICLTYCKPTETTLTIKKIIKKKEALVLAYIDNNLKTELKPTDDKIIDNSCVKRRPDRLYDCGTHFVIIEVDENQHGFYTDGCALDKVSQENRRMVQILEALSMGIVPVIFIRFNPDNFRVKEKLMKVNMQKRLEILLKWVEYSLKYDVEKFNGSMINVKYLFYNEYDETELEFEKIEV
jgi:hypothetical protein